MQTIHIDDIIINDRVRDPDNAAVESLARDILSKGLFHPILLKSSNDPVLIAGETRIKALRKLIEWDPDPAGCYTHNENLIPFSRIPFITTGELTPRQMLEYELAENLERHEIPWQERVRALARLHEELSEGRESATVTSTARKLVEAGSKKSENALKLEISKAIIVDTMLDHPEVANATSIKDAWTSVRKATHNLGETALKRAAMSETPVPHQLILGDAIEEMSKIGELFDLVLTDPPYGVEAGRWKSKFKDYPHQYDDSASNALTLCEGIILSSFTLSSPSANIFMFCAPQHWNRLFEFAESVGWVCWPRPIIWKKSNEGIRPWGTAGFAYTYEAILYATKQRGLNHSIADIIDVYKVHRHNRLHGAQKPVELLQRLIELVCVPGQLVVDPCCGSGSIFPAANITQTRAIGIELDPASYDLAKTRLREGMPEPDTSQYDLEDL